MVLFTCLRCHAFSSIQHCKGTPSHLDYDPLLSIYPFLPDHPCAFTCVGTPGGSEPADKSTLLCKNSRC